MEARGKEIVCKLLVQENVRYIFGNPGSTEVPLLDSLCGYPEIKYVLSLHESIAVSMADGYARASGNPGIVSVHAGPGTAHSLGGLFNAYKDNIPVIVIAGQQDSRMLLTEPFLSADLVQLARPLTKWAWQVSRGEELLGALRRAFKEATAPPRGPVLLSIPKNVLDEVADAEMVVPQRYRVPTGTRGDAEAMGRAAELLAGAGNAVIVAGMGVALSGAIAELVKLAEVVGAKVYAEPGSFPTDHQLYAGLADLDSIPRIARNGDVLMVVGTKMFAETSYSPRPIIPPETKAIHLDTSVGEVAKNFPLEAGIVADPKVGLGELAHLVQVIREASDSDAIDRRKATIPQVCQERGDVFRNILEEQAEGDFVRGGCLARDLQEVIGDNAIIVDQGLRGSRYIKRSLRFRGPGTYYAERGGCLGWAIGSAMGVRLARPDNLVVALVGDGSAMYYPQALWTAANENIPIVVILMNNRGYGAVKRHLMSYQGQALRQGNLIGTDIRGIDYVKMAESYGVDGVRVSHEARLKPALREAFRSGRPTLVEVLFDPNDIGFVG